MEQVSAPEPALSTFGQDGLTERIHRRRSFVVTITCAAQNLGKYLGRRDDGNDHPRSADASCRHARVREFEGRSYRLKEGRRTPGDHGRRVIDQTSKSLLGFEITSNPVGARTFCESKS